MYEASMFIMTPHTRQRQRKPNDGNVVANENCQKIIYDISVDLGSTCRTARERLLTIAKDISVNTILPFWIMTLLRTHARYIIYFKGHDA